MFSEKLEAHHDWVRDVAWCPSVGLPCSRVAHCSHVYKDIVCCQNESVRYCDHRVYACAIIILNSLTVLKVWQSLFPIIKFVYNHTVLLSLLQVLNTFSDACAWCGMPAGPSPRGHPLPLTGKQQGVCVNSTIMIDGYTQYCIYQ